MPKELKTCLSCGRPMRFLGRQPVWAKGMDWCDCKIKNGRRDSKLAKYGLEAADYHSMLSRQSGACAICLYVPDGEERGLSIDHHHGSGTVRGLLCTRCNMGLGYFKDDPERLMSAVAYLTATVESCC